MYIIHSIIELRQLIANYKQSAKVIALMPTMGSLHQGHLQLLELAKAKADIVVCSIFVNPLQFGQGEDFEQYPRTLAEDAEKLKAVGCDIVFAPSVDEMYPHSVLNGRDQTQVNVPVLSDILDGASRPGHFIGVATIVSKLFNMVQPDKAVFGEKDYQQLQIIRHFTRDLCFPVEILAHPIVRENNGLAMSSRNAYFSDMQKKQAGFIYQTLSHIATQIRDGMREYSALETNAQHYFSEQGFINDYVKICASDLTEATPQSQNLVVLVALYVDKIRLIDNIQIDLNN